MQKQLPTLEETAGLLGVTSPRAADPARERLIPVVRLGRQNRFLLGGRTWIPRWRFQPCENLADARQLWDTAKACRANL